MHPHLASLAPGCSFDEPPLGQEDNPFFRAMALTKDGCVVVTMPRRQWRVFLTQAQAHDVKVLPKPDSAAARTTHAGAKNPGTTIDRFIAVCVASCISPCELTVGRGGPGCGAVPLVPCVGNADASCILGASGMEFAPMEKLLSFPALLALDRIIKDPESSGVLFDIDLK